jgi:hypothetical protein
MPKKPDPNHPLAQAAADFHASLDASTSVPAADPPAPATEPVPAAVTLTAGEPVIAPTPAPSPAVDPNTKMQAMFDTMMGRFEAEREARVKAEADRETLRQNVDFLTNRVTSMSTGEEAARARVRQLEAELEATSAVKDFQSDKVDPEQFAEVFRGIQPHLAKRDAAIAEANQRAARAEEAAKQALEAADAKLGKMKQEILERNLVRGAPEIKTLLKQSDFQEFLAQRIPGARRTRLQELQDAYADGDEEFIVGLIGDFKLQGKPAAVPSGDPPRVVQNQTPRAPVKTEAVSEEMVQAAFQRYLNGELTRDEYKQISAAQKKQAAGT